MAEEQGVLIDVSHPMDAAMEKLAKKVRGHDRDRSASQKKADEGRGEMLNLMTKNKIERWVKGDFDVILKIGDAKVSVKQRGNKSDDDE